MYIDNDYLFETTSAFCSDEEELETLYLKEWGDFYHEPIEVEITKTIMPVLEEPEIVQLAESENCDRIWNFIKDVFTLKHCRNTS